MRCNLCPRTCGVNRAASYGRCGVGPDARVARSMLHRWEEPFISGTCGSGAVFFSGCNLGCVFCQNEPLQGGALGTDYDADRLAELFLSLASQGAHNVNLVTPTPHVPVIRRALILAKSAGLAVPVVYNTGAYERVATLRALEGLVDVYLPDCKYVSAALSGRFSDAPDYFTFAAPAIEEMFRQVGTLALDETGLAKRGLVIRHLVLPGCLDDSRRVLAYIAARFPPDTSVSLMRQYAPTPRAMHTPLNRVLTDREYDRIISYALSLGLNNILIQQKESADLAFTPSFTDYK